MVKLHIYMYAIEDGYKVAKCYRRMDVTPFEASKEIASAKLYLGSWYAGSMIKRKT